jgi:hypothetical protein
VNCPRELTASPRRLPTLSHRSKSRSPLRSRLRRTPVCSAAFTERPSRGLRQLRSRCSRLRNQSRAGQCRHYQYESAVKLAQHQRACDRCRRHRCSRAAVFCQPHPDQLGGSSGPGERKGAGYRNCRPGFFHGQWRRHLRGVRGPDPGELGDAGTDGKLSISLRPNARKLRGRSETSVVPIVSTSFSSVQASWPEFVECSYGYGWRYRGAGAVCRSAERISWTRPGQHRPAAGKPRWPRPTHHRDEGGWQGHSSGNSGDPVDATKLANVCEARALAV